MHATQNTAVIDGRPATRSVTGAPETDADRRFFDLREGGYSGPIDQDGHPTVTFWPNEPAPAGVGTTLRDAARYLSRYGWIQGCYYDATATVFTPAACMVGAIAIVCYGGPVEAPAQMFDHPGFADFEAAITWLDRHLLDRHGVISYEFNDAKDRTKVDVLIELVGAGKLWDRINGGAA